MTIPRSERVSTEHGWKSILLENINRSNLNCRFRLKRLILICFFLPGETSLCDDPPTLMQKIGAKTIPSKFFWRRAGHCTHTQEKHVWFPLLLGSSKIQPGDWSLLHTLFSQIGQLGVVASDVRNISYTLSRVRWEGKWGKLIHRAGFLH